MELQASLVLSKFSESEKQWRPAEKVRNSFQCVMKQETSKIDKECQNLWIYVL